MQLVLSLADEGETMQSLCSDPSTGSQSEFRLRKKFPLCAIVAGIYPLLPTSHLLAVYQPSCSLHSEDALHGFMNVPRINLNMSEKRAFSYIGPVT